MAYQMASTAVTLNDLGHSPVTGLFKCNPSNVCAAFYTISTESVVARFLFISKASCQDILPLTLRVFPKKITNMTNRPTKSVSELIATVTIKNHRHIRWRSDDGPQSHKFLGPN